MKDVLNDFKSCGRPMNKNELKIKELEEENKKLKEKNQYIFENVNDDELLRSNAMNFAEKNELQDRINKAIEYIHNNQPVFELSSKEQLQEWFEKEYYVELLKILKEEENGKV